MRINEILTEDQLDELDIKKAIATGALGLGLAAGTGAAQAGQAQQAPNDGVNAKPVATQQAQAGTQSMSKSQYSTAHNSTATLAAIAKSGMLNQFLNANQLKNMSTWNSQLKGDPRWDDLSHQMGYSDGVDAVKNYQAAKTAHDGYNVRSTLAAKSGNMTQSDAAHAQKHAYEMLRSTAQQAYNDVAQSMGSTK